MGQSDLASSLTINWQYRALVLWSPQTVQYSTHT